MTREERIKTLVDDFHYVPTTAKAYVDSGGRCAYCGADLVASRLAHAAGAIDHILPESKYPELASNADNLVLCCPACNWFKGSRDFTTPKEREGDLAGNLANLRNHLILRVREHVRARFAETYEEWQAVKDIILDQS